MLSVLIVNWNTRDKLRACLASLQDCGHEVIVVDNASSDGSAAMVQESFPWVKLLEPGGNTGYAAGNNIAMAHASGAFLLTLNPDTEVPVGALDKALWILQEHPECGCLAPRLQGPEGEIQASVRGFPTMLGVLGAFLKLDRLFPRSVLGSYRLPAFDYSREQYAAQPMGTFLLFRRQALEALRGGGEDLASGLRPFDESFPIFFNEVDLLRRMEDTGWKTLFTPAITILHHHGSSTKQVKKPMIWESHRSLMRYLHKHTKGMARFVLPLFALIVWAGALIRARGIYAGFRPDHHDL